MSGLQIFENGEFSLRITEYDDTFRVDATDLAHSLGMRYAYRLVESLPEKEKVKGYTLSCTSDDQGVWEVLEPGFYRAIGQRQPARIKNADVRAQVVRFQDWVFGEVLPAIRKHGSYGVAAPAPQPALPPAPPFEPKTYPFSDAVVLMRQQFGVNIAVNDLTSTLRAGGVLKQDERAPMKDHSALFWLKPGTSTYEVFEHAIPALYRLYESTKIRIHYAAQASLAVEPMGWVELPLPE